MQGTQFRRSWNHALTLLTMSLARLTLHLAFRTCSRRVWPVCPSAHTPQEDRCRTACGHLRASALLTHPTLPPQSVHSCTLCRCVLSSSWPPKRFIFVLGHLDNPKNQPRTAHVTFHLVHALQRERTATVQLRTHRVSSCASVPLSSVVQQVRVNPRAVDKRFANRHMNHTALKKLV